MRQRIAALRLRIKGKTLSIAVFSYALAVGTSLPLLTARCGTNCATCGYCGVMFGVLPLVLVLVTKDRVRRKLRPMLSFFTRHQKDGAYERLTD